LPYIHPPMLAPHLVPPATASFSSQEAMHVYILLIDGISIIVCTELCVFQELLGCKIEDIILTHSA
jgi:hypothetical protein